MTTTIPNLTTQFPVLHDDTPINAYLQGDRQCVVHDPDTVHILHSHYRIVVKMIGSLPFHSSQNIYHSLPGLIPPDATTLALKRGWIKILKQKVQPITENNDSTNREDLSQEAPDTRKRMKMVNAYDENERIVNEFMKPHVTLTGISETMYHLPNETFVRDTHAQYEDASTEWKYPETEKERNRYKVFEALYNKGYFVTSGDRFGCDFLVYKEDPLIYHSEWMVYVVSEEETWNPFPMISIGRLGNYVHKTVIYACVVRNNGEEQVKFLSWNWFDLETLKLYRKNKRKQQQRQPPTASTLPKQPNKHNLNK